MSTPEINVQDLEGMLKSEEDFVLLDVREPWELARASWDDARLRLAPMSELSQRGLEAMPFSTPNDLPLIVVCHYGIRSIQVTNWLLAQDWSCVVSLSGGIEAYAHQIDPSVGKY